MKCCINDVNFIRLLLLSKFEIQKYGQILCVHKPYFLMPGHKSLMFFSPMWSTVEFAKVFHRQRFALYGS